MNAFEFLKTAGNDEAKTVAEAAGTSFAYFKQLAYGHRRPSVDLAQELVRASGGRMEFQALLTTSRREAA